MSRQEDWLGRWREGRIGWHEPGGNVALQEFWPVLPAGSRVLVPLCGKAVDLHWLAQRGLHVSGVELSPLAIEEFFAENSLEYRKTSAGKLVRYTASSVKLDMYCGDYFEFDGGRFDALFDRGALVALPAESRPRYVEHTDSLLKPGAFRLLVTLEYDQAQVAGPPFAVAADEVRGYWRDLERVSSRNDIENAPPKFRAAGLSELAEVTWRSPLERDRR